MPRRHIQAGGAVIRPKAGQRLAQGWPKGCRIQR